MLASKAVKANRKPYNLDLIMTNNIARTTRTGMPFNCLGVSSTKLSSCTVDTSSIAHGQNRT